MRTLLLLWLLTAGCLQAEPFRWPWSKKAAEKKEAWHFRLPWNSRTKEQSRLNAAMSPKPTSREEEIMHPDMTKEFNPATLNPGSAHSISGKTLETGTFHFEDKVRTKSFATRDFSTKEAAGMSATYETKAAPTKESWFAHRSVATKTFATKANADANKEVAVRPLPEADKIFVPRGRRQAELDAEHASGRTPKLPFGEDRDAGQSWSGELRPLTIEDVKNLLNKN